MIINIGFDTAAADVKKFKKDLKHGKEELLPSEFVTRVINGENIIRIWREYRGFTQADLAKAADISKPYLSQLENN